jgi:hypothetical protein
MNKNKEFTPNISGTNKSVTGSGLEGWLALLGVVVYFAAIYLARGTDLAVITLMNGSLVGDFITWPSLIFFTSALLILLVGNFFCTKNSDGKYEYKERHMWARPLMLILLGLAFTCVGWIAAALCSGFSGI